MSNELNETGADDSPKVETQPRFVKDGWVRYNRQPVQILEVHAEGLRLPGYAGFVAAHACTPIAAPAGS